MITNEENIKLESTVDEAREILLNLKREKVNNLQYGFETTDFYYIHVSEERKKKSSQISLRTTI